MGRADAAGMVAAVGAVTASRPLRFGLAGGNFSLRVLLPAIRMAGHEVVAFAGRDLAKARSAATTHGIATAFGSVDELLDHPIDAVALALPPVDCIAAATAAASRGIPVFAEKPLGPTAESIRELARVARAPVVVDYEFAELPSFRRLGEMASSGRLGSVERVVVTWQSRSRDLAERRWTWKGDRLRGGGVLGLYGSHILHALLSMIGPVCGVEATVRAEATGAIAPPDAEVAEEAARLSLACGPGIQAEVDLDMAAPGPYFHRWDVWFERGHVQLDNSVTNEVGRFAATVRTAAGETETTVDASDGMDPLTAASARRVERLAQTVQQGLDTTPHLALAAEILDVVEAARRVADRTARPPTARIGGIG